jgi:very-short-patch-repair endonuclease
MPMPERILLTRLERAALPQPERECRFHPVRRWRFDYAWPQQRVALEVEGAIWVQGRHTRGSGFLKDMEKYNTAASHGWLVLRTTPDALGSSETFAFVEEALRCRLD